MKPRRNAPRTHAIGLALAGALCLGAGLALAADKKPEEKKEKTPEKKPAEPKNAGGAKAAAKDAPLVITNTPPIVVSFPKASFATALEAGQDPFFPRSKRRVPKVPEPPKPKPVVISPSANPLVIPPAVVTNTQPASTNAAPAVVPPPDLIGSANLTLRGLSGTRTRRVAVVHSGARTYDFLKGDSTLIRLPNDKQLKVRCVDIRERSAVFEAEGETKELFLREGVF